MVAFHFILSLFGIRFLKDKTKTNDDAKKKILEEYIKSCYKLNGLKEKLAQAICDGNKETQDKIRNETSRAIKKWQSLRKEVQSNGTRPQ